MSRDNSYLIGNQFAKGHKPNTTMFAKGHTPWNKDTRGIHLSPATEFKIGRRSPNILRVGTIRQRRDKNGKARNYIKVREHRWVESARHLWEITYGWISGDVVHHLDGNSLNDELDNLLAMPRCDHPVFHSRWGLHRPSTKQVIFYLARYPIGPPRRL